MRPNDFWFFYAGLLFAVILVLFWRRPKKGMRLRLKGSGGGAYTEKIAQRAHLTVVNDDHSPGERSLNVVFQYNGHSWDAFEVLGLPAGSSLETVEAAYKESLARVDDKSKPFMDAAYQAIRKAANRAS